MKRAVSILFILTCLCLAGCGIKPDQVDPPPGVSPDPFPYTYPDPLTDPRP